MQITKQQIEEIRKSKEDKVIFKIFFPNKEENAELYLDFTADFLNERIPNKLDAINDFKRSKIYPITRAYNESSVSVFLEYMSDNFSTNKHL